MKRQLFRKTGAVITACSLGFFAPACAGTSQGFPPSINAEAPSYPGPSGDEAAAVTLEKTYKDLLESHTQRVQGIRNRFETPVAYWVSYVSWPVRMAELKVRSVRGRWTAEEWDRALAEARAQHEKGYLFRLSFYAHNYDENWIAASEKAPWQAFLVLPDGTRTEPSQIREPRLADGEIEWLYPRHDRFSKYYEIEFPRTATAPDTAPQPDASFQLEITGDLNTNATTWHLSRDPGPVSE